VGDCADQGHSASPLSSQISPTQQHDNFDFNSFLPGMRGDDPASLSVDYTALDDLEDGIEHWRLTQGPVLDGTGSEQSDDSDVEMGELVNGVEPSQNGNQDVIDGDMPMVDNGDKVCYGMVRLPPRNAIHG
jgi:hypothetical protein